MKTSTVLALTLAAILGGGAVLGAGGLVYVNGVRNEVIRQETQLSAEYLDNQNVLSAYVTAFYEQVGIADRKSDQLDRIITDAIKGRYQGDTSAQPGGGALFSAIQEAYPQIDLSTYDKIQDFIVKSRGEFKGEQTQLLKLVEAYQNYLNQGLLKSIVINFLGYPSDNLTARVDGRVIKGDAALEQIQQIVLDDNTSKAFGTGKMNPLSVPPLQGAPVGQ